MKWMVTGIYGFIGSNFARMLYAMGEEVVGVDAITYASNHKNIEGFDIEVFDFVKIASGHMVDAMADATDKGEIDVLVNFAAESHVDRSIGSSKEFIQSNIVGVGALLDLSLKHNIGRFVQVSTDEVYGSVEQQEGQSFTEDMKLLPNSPYSASKAAADLLVQSYVHTHGLNAVITRCSNNYGPFQHPEKMMPKCILNSLDEKEIPLYGDGMNVRDWIHVQDHCRGIYAAATGGRKGRIYNFGGANPMTNAELIRRILKETGGSEKLVKSVEDRKGHDRTYEVNYERATQELNWRPSMTFAEGLSRTVEWYSNNRDWWEQ